MQLIRHFVVLISLMFWQGGFMFYGGVVVPVGTRILGSETEQGFITQSVTNYLNLAGVVCLTLWVGQMWQERKQGVSKLEWSVWTFLAGSMATLVWIHIQIDHVLNSDAGIVLDDKRFDIYHKFYLGISSLQWLASLALLFLAIRRWNTPRATG